MTEKENKWTRGPWRADGPDYFSDFNILHDANSLAVGAVVSNLRPITEVSANAHLIAAAPELYEALEAMLDDPINFELAEAALAKARGEQP